MEKKIEELLNNMIKDNIINKKDKEVMRLCLLLLTYGWKEKDKIRKLVNVSDKKFDKMWNNLKNGGYFADDGKINIEHLDNDIPVILMSLCAEGLIRGVR